MALTIVFTHRIFVLLFMLIPVCACFEYTFFRGRMNYAALLAAFSAASVYMLNFAVQLCYFAEYFGIAFSDALSLFPAVNRDPEAWIEVSENLGFILCAVFTVLGIFLAWVLFSRAAKSGGRDAATAGSAIPCGGSGAGEFYYGPADYATPFDDPAPADTDRKSY